MAGHTLEKVLVQEPDPASPEPLLQKQTSPDLDAIFLWNPSGRVPSLQVPLLDEHTLETHQYVANGPLLYSAAVQFLEMLSSVGSSRLLDLAAGPFRENR